MREEGHDVFPRLNLSSIADFKPEKEEEGEGEGKEATERKVKIEVELVSTKEPPKATTRVESIEITKVDLAPIPKDSVMEFEE